MTKAELINELTHTVRESGRNIVKADTEVFLAALGMIAQQALASGDSVPLTGIGRLEIKKRRARQGRNPRTGETLEIPACIVPVFRASGELKAAAKGMLAPA